MEEIEIIEIVQIHRITTTKNKMTLNNMINLRKVEVPLKLKESLHKTAIIITQLILKELVNIYKSRQLLIKVHIQSKKYSKLRIRF